MKETGQSKFTSYAAAWLVAAAFGFSIYVVGLVFYGENYAWLVGIGAFIVIGAALSYVYVALPQRLFDRLAEEEMQVQRKIEAEKAAQDVPDPEPDFDWDDDALEGELGEVEEASFLDEEGESQNAADGEKIEGENADIGKPVGYASPEGEADDLKKIKGVGPKLEEMLNEMGFFHFAQIAEWQEAEIAWVDENLEGFKGRASRDEWVEQARSLMEEAHDDA